VKRKNKGEKMKLIKTLAVLSAVCCGTLTSQATLTLNFSSLTGASIQFNGPADTFQINSAVSGNAFNIGLETGSQSTGVAQGLNGGLSSGPFSYGAISSDVSGNQYATVTGPSGTFFIVDGNNQLLSGTVNWMQVSTSTGNGNPVGVNAQLTVNISGVTYSGNNADLQTLDNLAALNFGSMDLSFSFNPGQTLTQLSTGPSQQTAFSGALSVPEPTTMVAGAMLLLPFGASTLRILRRKSVS
jgi:hypothetical protein